MCRPKQEDKKPTKKIKCNMCHKTFTTELDDMGIPYKRRCSKCSKNLRINGNQKYRDAFVSSTGGTGARRKSESNG